jgi:chemotaxis protein CheC
MEMTAIEKDILTELLNICLSKAADSFARISGQDVLIKVPEIILMEKDTALKELISKQDVEMLVQSEIKGDIYGQTLLLFSPVQVEELNKTLVKKIDPGDKYLKESLLLEISNILTGTLVTYLASILKLNMYGSVPNAPIYRKNITPDQLLLDMDMSRSILVTVNTLFIKSNNSVNLPMMLIFDIVNLQKLLDVIGKINLQDKVLTRK